MGAQLPVDFNQIKQNLPTCINVSWRKAYQEHCRALQNPFPIARPRVYQLETTNLCNLSCVMCPRNKMSRPLGTMPFSLFKKIVNRDLRWTKAVELFGFGEPFMDKELGKKIKYLHSKGIWVTIATNGLLLGAKDEKTLKEIDYLVFDVDSIDKEQYEKIRVGGSYDRMLENLERVLRVRDKYTVIQYINIDKEKMPKFLERYADKADEVRVKFLDTFAGQVGEVENQADVCCLEVFYGVSIWQNGDVVMCDRDFDSKYLLGNVKEKSLIDIWQDKKSEEIKSYHRCHKGEYIDLCARCKEWKLTNLRNVPELTVNMFKGGFV